MNIEQLLNVNGPVALVIKATFQPVAGQERFQPAGFPEIGAVFYKDPRQPRDICIVDSAASMANHLESVCMAGNFDSALHPDLRGLPHVICVTDRERNAPSKDDPRDHVVCTTLTEGHRLASDYFLDAQVEPAWVEDTKPAKGKKDAKPRWQGTPFREKLRENFGIVEVTRDKKYFVHPDDWWTIFKTIFRYDPNSLVHGVMFAREQIKIARLLSASLEAFGAKRVGRSGVKFDRLGKTTSGQPIFSVEEETADSIIGTFVIDLALLRSYGRDGNGLNDAQKRLLLELAIWKIRRLTAQPFRFRSGCYLESTGIEVDANGEKTAELPQIEVAAAITKCGFKSPRTTVYYPAAELFKVGKEEAPAQAQPDAARERVSED